MENTSKLNESVMNNVNAVRLHGIENFEHGKRYVSVKAAEYAAALAWKGFCLSIEKKENGDLVAIIFPEKYSKDGVPELQGMSFFMYEVGKLTKGEEEIPVIVLREENISGFDPLYIIMDELSAYKFDDRVQLGGKWYTVHPKRTAERSEEAWLLSNPLL